MKKNFEVLGREIVYPGFFRMEKYRLKHTLYDGGWSEEISRELFVRGNCVAVLLYDPTADKLVLIEQFRAGAILNPDRAWLVEIVAGAIEAGETAEEVAYRESIEEAGCTIEQIKVINEFYTTPGGSSERITLFCGKIDSSQVGGIHGLDHEHEDILVRAVSFDEAYQMVVNGEIESAIPIIAIQWLALNKRQLLAEWAS
ncbi:MAG: NUDIX domain-containing protein [Methylococcaceae bacterium]|nr:NUDIX domain-containing protein [Methylococcaceae bacterium]MDZ4155975.1 NUDIX domain-containing protein [Methylococcales bacterium]MDP2395206.1 NUDIX domain-containing protein [Methylococcaceae bacterium]MDP3018652.1 NUDIX domain-containing protein [Methylococcaceae bacterium]MDP3388846.1 NUDIX domain-containing protein [Methylococcaceae bacterium]